jgi:hypothetical protein
MEKMRRGWKSIVLHQISQAVLPSCCGGDEALWISKKDKTLRRK